MKIIRECFICGQKTESEIQVGDVVKPYDGSGMPNGLHSILWNGAGRRHLPLPQEEAFKPVRVVSIEGDMLAVVPFHWDKDRGTARKEEFSNEIYPALCPIWKETYDGWGVLCDHAFWIHGPTSNLHLLSRDNKWQNAI